MRILRKYPLVTFFVLAYAFTWWIYPLVRFAPLLGLAGLFGPALAAMVMAAITGGRPGLKALLTRTVLWRVGLPWYAAALGLPAVVALVAAGLYFLLGSGAFFQPGRLSVLDFVLFVLVVGEELGWRGYALPKLLERRSPLTASLILGVLWGLWHLPTFLVPGLPQYGLPLTAFVLLTIEYSVLLTWLYLHTKGSVLIATLAHGSINLSQGLLLGGVDGATRYWLLSIAWGAAALVLAVVLVRSSSSQPATRVSGSSPVGSRDVRSRTGRRPEEEGWLGQDSTSGCSRS